MTRYTRSGKVVGSYRTPMDHFYYGPQVQGYSSLPDYGNQGFMTYAPSGAAMRWFENEADAMLYCETKNKEWDQ